MITIIGWALLVVLISILLIDLVPLAWTWASRIHIGRFSDIHEWRRSITNRGLVWLNRTPTLKVTDHNRLIVLDMMKGNYASGTIQQWQEAALLLGLAERLATHPDSETERHIERFLSRRFTAAGSWIEKPKYVDAAILAYALFKLDGERSGKYKAAMDETWEMIKAHIGEDGTVQYRKNAAGYRYVDTIGFICPFLIAYGIRYGKPECVELSVRQISQFEQHGMLRGSAIPNHAYKVGEQLPLGLYGWGRGLGWYAIGLIDAWKELPGAHPSKPQLERYVADFANTVMRLQQPNGGWNWTVTRSESRSDSSAVAMLSWFLVGAAEIPALREQCLKHTDKAIRYLMQVTRRDGTIDFSQGDTKDIGVYSTQFDRMPFTQGFGMRVMNRLAADETRRGA